MLDDGQRHAAQLNLPKWDLWGKADNMADILMVNVPYAGHTNPTLPLSEALVRRGHNVCYINAEEFRSKIESTGATFMRLV